MYQVLQLVTLSLLAGSTCAVFYIPGSVVSYPKMGKRAFYTNATGNRYPLMGRRTSPTNDQGQGQSQGQNNAEMAAVAAGALVQNGDEFNKRGVFTKGPHRSFPRVGRSDASSSESFDATVSGKIRSQILKGLAERLDRNILESSEISNLVAAGQQQGAAQSAESSESLKALQLPHMLFLVFDENGDNQLSKAEFTLGLAKALEQNLLC